MADDWFVERVNVMRKLHGHNYLVRVHFGRNTVGLFGVREEINVISECSLGQVCFD